MLFGCTVLICAVIAKFVFDNDDYSNLLAMASAVLLGGPIVYGAAKSLITGRCSHDHGDLSHDCGGASCKDPAHDQDHEHTHRSDSHMEELVALAIIASFADGQYLETAAVAFFMLIASLIEHRTAVGALKGIEAFLRLAPTKAVKLAEDGSETEVQAATLSPGDRVLVLPGDNIPGDGQIIEGLSTIMKPTSPVSRCPWKRTSVTRSTAARSTKPAGWWSRSPGPVKTPRSARCRSSSSRRPAPAPRLSGSCRSTRRFTPRWS